MDGEQAIFEILPTVGIKAYINEGGSISLYQFDPYLDNEPSIVVIEAYQIDTIIGWLQQMKAIIEG